MKKKRIEGNWFSYGKYGLSYEKGVVFSANKISKPKWCDPVQYSVFFQPFSLIFVFFSLKPGRKNVKDHSWPIYEVDEEEFMKKMAEWGVELEDTTMRYKKR